MNLAVNQSVPKPPESRLRTYLFVVVGGAIFLSSLAIGLKTQPPESAVAIISRHGDSATPATPFAAAALDELMSPASIEAALASAEPAQFVVPQSQVSELKRLLRVEQSPVGVDGSVRLTITIDSSSPRSATVVNALAKSFVERHWGEAERQARGAARDADEAADAAQRAAAAAQRQLERYRRDHAAQLASRQSATKSDVPTPNPEYVELDNQLRAMQAQRDQLLTRMTTEHPTIARLDEELTHLRDRRQATQQFLTEPAEPATAVSGESERQGELEQQAIYAVHTHEAAIDAAETAKQMLDAHLAKRIDVLRLASTDPVSMPAAWPTLVLAVALAVVVGGGVAAGGVPDDPTFRDTTELEQSLKLPIVGALSPGEQSPTAFRLRLPTFARAAKLSGELTLAVFTFAIIVLAIAEPDFLGQLMHSPLTAIPAGVERLREML